MNIDFVGVQRMDDEINHEPIIPTEPFPYKPSIRVHRPYPPTRGFKRKKDDSKQE